MTSWSVAVADSCVVRPTAITVSMVAATAMSDTVAPFCPQPGSVGAHPDVSELQEATTAVLDASTKVPRREIRMGEG